MDPLINFEITIKEAIDSTNGEMATQRVNGASSSSSTSMNPEVGQVALVPRLYGNEPVGGPSLTGNMSTLAAPLHHQQQEQLQQQLQQMVLQQNNLQQALSAQAALTSTAIAALPASVAGTITNIAGDAITPALNAAMLLGRLNAVLPAIVAGQQQQQQNLIGATMANPAIAMSVENAAFLNQQSLAMLGAQFPYLLSGGQQAQFQGTTAAPSTVPPVACLPFPFGALVGANISPINNSVVNPVASAGPVASLFSSGDTMVDQRKMQEILESFANISAPSTSAVTLLRDPSPSAAVRSTVNKVGKPSNTNKGKGKSSTTAVSGRPSIIVYMDCDDESLSDYQCILRKQIELFEATGEDVQWNAQGRNKAVRALWYLVKH
jgi:hypothetical protein